MGSSARIFFAGVGTTFAIIAIGFGGGLLLANSALDDPPRQVRASSQPPSGVRVILPASAEPAPQVTAAVSTPQPQPQPQLQPVAVATEKQVEKTDAKKAERDAKVERRRHAERKARRVVAERARARGAEPKVMPEPSIMAFDDDAPRTNFFGN